MLANFGGLRSFDEELKQKLSFIPKPTRTGRTSRLRHRRNYREENSRENPITPEANAEHEKKRIIHWVVITLLAMIFLIILFTVPCADDHVKLERRCKGTGHELNCAPTAHRFKRECWLNSSSCWINGDTRCGPTECMVHSLNCPKERICIGTELYTSCEDYTLYVFQRLSIVLFVSTLLRTFYQVFKWRLRLEVLDFQDESKF
jgi:hypothetical protein